MSESGWHGRCVEVNGGEVAVYERGQGAPWVFLHGLGGYGLEWDDVATALGENIRSITYDQRGHGGSTRRPSDVSREAYVAEAVAVITEAIDQPVTLVGQSMGAHTALMLAAARPDLVARLILVEGGVGGEGEQASEAVITWFRSWPVPFVDVESASGFFGGGPSGRAWAAGLCATAEGFVPRFDVDILDAALRAVHRTPRWTEWGNIKCPVLLIRGSDGYLPEQEMKDMLARSRQATSALVMAGHDVHLDAPEDLAQALINFG